MAGIWCLLGYRRPDRRCHFADTFMVYLHFLSYAWVARDRVYDTRLLDEY